MKLMPLTNITKWFLDHAKLTKLTLSKYVFSSSGNPFPNVPIRFHHVSVRKADGEESELDVKRPQNFLFL